MLCDAALLALLIFVGLPTQAAEPQPATSKERLSDKASDDQRVDNCNVPPERRGTRPRPDCKDKASQPPKDGERQRASTTTSVVTELAI
jgi:hypothetical protein